LIEKLKLKVKHPDRYLL